MNRVPAYRIPNLANACRVLRALGDESAPQTTSALAKRLNLPRTSCLRIVETLCDEGLLTSSEAGYSLGLGLVSLGFRALELTDISGVAGPFLERLTELTGETSHLAQWSQGKSLIVRVCDSRYALRAASRPGTLALAHCSATGKIFLAWNFADRIKEITPEGAREARTPRTLITNEQLTQELHLIRKRGYAVDNEEYHPGVRCLAAPVTLGEGRVVAALGITGVASRLPLGKLASVAEQVQNIARQLSAALADKSTTSKERRSVNKESQPAS